MPVIFIRFNEIRIFVRALSKNSQISNLMKICPVRAELFACGRMDGHVRVHNEAYGRFFAVLRKGLKIDYLCIALIKNHIKTILLTAFVLP